MKSFCLYLLIILFIANNVLLAQEKALAKIHYNFSHVNDTNQRDQPQKDEVVLYLGKHSSFYKSYSDERVKESIADQKLAADFTGHMTLNFNTSPIKVAYIIKSDPKEIMEIKSVSSGFDAYANDVPYESQDWKIEDETREIGGYLCQKATAMFKGRNYIAWFTSDIPFPFGPWKLHGLPGLILSAYDVDNEVCFEYAGFDVMTEEVLIDIPFYVLKAKKEDIEKQREKFEKDQGLYFKVLNESGRMSIANTYYGIDYSKHSFDFKTKEDYRPSFIINNPIEKL